MSLDLVCPHCRALEVGRVHRRLWERLLLFSRAYRCNVCYYRFVTTKGEPPSPKTQASRNVAPTSDPV